MPSKSAKQRRFMGAELGRLRRGQPTQTKMGEEQLRDFARKPSKQGKRRGSVRRQTTRR